MNNKQKRSSKRTTPRLRLLTVFVCLKESVRFPKRLLLATRERARRVAYASTDERGTTPLRTVLFSRLRRGRERRSLSPLFQSPPPSSCIVCIRACVVCYISLHGCPKCPRFFGAWIRGRVFTKFRSWFSRCSGPSTNTPLYDLFLCFVCV